MCGLCSLSATLIKFSIGFAMMLLRLRISGTRHAGHGEESAQSRSRCASRRGNREALPLGNASGGYDSPLFSSNPKFSEALT